MASTFTLWLWLCFKHMEGWESPHLLIRNVESVALCWKHISDLQQGFWAFISHYSFIIHHLAIFWDSDKTNKQNFLKTSRFKSASLQEDSQCDSPSLLFWKNDRLLVLWWVQNYSRCTNMNLWCLKIWIVWPLQHQVIWLAWEYSKAHQTWVVFF